MTPQHALIIGAGGDIGKSISALLSHQGYRVVGTTREFLDLSDRRSVAEFIRTQDQSFAHIVFAAALNNPMPYKDITDASIDEALRVNVLAFLEILRGLIAAMPKTGNKSVTMISSLLWAAAWVGAATIVIASPLTDKRIFVFFMPRL